ncbi:MAG: PepSY domain-containing protein [Planctomycetes bacterium]|nr:PepSY domain-containing protein [Planctomycetota bacterium]
MRRLHRLLGLVLVLPLVLWIATGLLFHVKHRYGEAYEKLSVPSERAVDWSTARIAPAEVIARGLANPPLQLAIHPSGRLAYFGALENTPKAIDAATGEPIEPATDDIARGWIAAALSSSPNAARYGDEVGHEDATANSGSTGTLDPVFVLHTRGGKTVSLDRVTGAIRQTGDLNDFIDATYKAHYLQWTPWEPVNIALVLLSIPIVLLLAFTGLRMAFRKS